MLPRAAADIIRRPRRLVDLRANASIVFRGDANGNNRTHCLANPFPGRYKVIISCFGLM
jgi:hypothetical protein